MARVKRSVAARKKRRKVLEQAKGYWGLKHSSYQRAVDLLLRAAVARMLEPPVALGLLEDLAALLSPVDGTLDARHGSGPPPQQLAHFTDVAGRDGVLAAEVTLSLGRLLLEI